MKFPLKVNLVEFGPRDGFQAVSEFIPTTEVVTPEGDLGQACQNDAHAAVHRKPLALD